MKDINQRDLARLGARIRLAELAEERAALLSAFPDLANAPSPEEQRALTQLERVVFAGMPAAGGQRPAAASNDAPRGVRSGLQPDARKRPWTPERRAKFAATWARKRKEAKR